jgi:sulfhydrogenase subunit beta (sulfur reductase)
MKKVAKKDIAGVLAKWQQDYTVLVPSRDSGVAEMVVWDGRDTAFLDRYRNTVVPPKANFFLNVEKLFGFSKDGGTYKINPASGEGRKQLIFGIRPCDARAAGIIDMVFKDAYEDRYYVSRRENSALVGLACTNPYDSCFCTSLGSGPGESGDVDLLLTDIGDAFLVEEVTEKGRALMAGVEAAAAGEDDGAKAAEVKRAAAQKVTRKIDTKEIAERLPAAFDNEAFWKKVAAKCVSCGICTFLCPTCYCFDINDEMLKGEGARYRNWDSCSFPLYTKMPAENPREARWRRVRQKVNHKYTFYPMLFDVIACTGCGRCIRLCPVNWDITQTLASVPAAAPVTEKK